MTHLDCWVTTDKPLLSTDKPWKSPDNWQTTTVDLQTTTIGGWLTNHNCQLTKQRLLANDWKSMTFIWQTMNIGWRLKTTTVQPQLSAEDCQTTTVCWQQTTHKCWLTVGTPKLSADDWHTASFRTCPVFPAVIVLSRCSLRVPGRGSTCPPPTTRTGPPPPEWHVERSGYQDHASHSVSLKTGGITSGYVRNFRRNPNVS